MSADSPEKTIMSQADTGILLDGLNEVLAMEYGMGLDQDRCGWWPDKPAERGFCVSSVRHNLISLDCKRSGIWPMVHFKPRSAIENTLVCKSSTPDCACQGVGEPAKVQPALPSRKCHTDACMTNRSFRSIWPHGVSHIQSIAVTTPTILS
jgi:hypothetical protein